MHGFSHFRSSYEASDGSRLKLPESVLAEEAASGCFNFVLGREALSDFAQHDKGVRFDLTAMNGRCSKPCSRVLPTN